MPKEISTSELTSAQKIKIRKLLRTKDENNICFAIELLQTTQRNDTDLKDIFSKRILYQLAGTMDYSICKLVNTAVMIDDSLRTCFNSGLKKRFGDQSIKKQNSLLSAMLLDIDANLIDTIKDLFGMMKTVGPLSAGGYDQFDASALSTLDRDQASVLAGCCATEIHLNGLAKLPAPIALILSGKSGHYSFDGLTRLEPDTAKHLAKLEGSISINSLPAISNVCVKALGSFRGKLQLEGLRKLGKSAADLLASQSTEVWLNGLTKITTDAATSFNVHRHDLLLDGLPIISEDVANAASVGKRYVLPSRSLSFLQYATASSQLTHVAG